MIRTHIRALVCIVMTAAACTGCGTRRCVTFDGLAPGTKFGGQVSTPPGSAIANENGINVVVLPFQPLSGPQRFNLARVDSGAMGSGNAMLTSSVSLGFDMQ
jgi:hypothetical protein